MLNLKQKMFVEEYLCNGMNARQAYKTVYKTDKKKPSYPYELIRKPEVAEYLEKRRQEIYQALQIDALRINSELAKMAFEPTTDDNKNTKIKALDLLSRNLSIQTQRTENKDIIEVQLVEDIKDGNG